jgi:hypothetical protein
VSMNTPVPVPVVPAKVRFVLYWLSWGASTLAGLVSGTWAIVAAASPDVTAPVWVTIASPVLLLVTAQLNALAGSNVTNASSLVVRREEGGVASLLLVGVVLAVLGLVVWLFSTADVVGLILLVVGVILAIYAAATTRTGV